MVKILTLRLCAKVNGCVFESGHGGPCSDPARRCIARSSAGSVHWRCSLPSGHGGPHAFARVNPEPRDAHEGTVIPGTGVRESDNSPIDVCQTRAVQAPEVSELIDRMAGIFERESLDITQPQRELNELRAKISIESSPLALISLATRCVEVAADAGYRKGHNDRNADIVRRLRGL